MTRTNPQVNIRLDNKKEAQRRADEDYRGNLTAYINDLIKRDINSISLTFKRLARESAKANAHLKKLKAKPSKKKKV